MSEHNLSILSMVPTVSLSNKICSLLSSLILATYFLAQETSQSNLLLYWLGILSSRVQGVRNCSIILSLESLTGFFKLQNERESQ